MTDTAETGAPAVLLGMLYNVAYAQEFNRPLSRALETKAAPAPEVVSLSGT